MTTNALGQNIKCQNDIESDCAVELDHVTVAYRSYRERPTSIKEGLIRFLKTGRLKYFSTFDAVSDVSFKVKRGQIFGIIGSNGAGKSTLLRTIVGVLPPAAGKIKINGSIDSLITLGAGFDSDLNAIENIYLNGSLHQLSKDEITQRVPGIIEFAELQEFSLTPIKYYSSGMNARLGFATAIDKDPDILVVDEVLSVGDERFRVKCESFFENFIARKRTIIIVSHNLGYLEKHADVIALLSRGRLVFIGDAKEAIKIYKSEAYQTTLR